MTERTGFITARPIAHRGLHDVKSGIVENTSSAFQAALDKGYAIECDLQLTADGEAVLFHDDHLGRLTEASGMVKDMTAAQMKALTIRQSGDHVQTLAELLAQVRGRMPLVIELKSHWDGNTRLAARALEVLTSYRGPFCLMSFDPDMIEAVRRL
ncbi:MAG: glycerophosphodiester phosphodiesterase, partial [Aestuariivirga sp.]|nr:glycerophosphodiester phosphodiesterase [Aestuariivirga sp.]